MGGVVVVVVIECDRNTNITACPSLRWGYQSDSLFPVCEKIEGRQRKATNQSRHEMMKPIVPFGFIRNPRVRRMRGAMHILYLTEQLIVVACR